MQQQHLLSSCGKPGLMICLFTGNVYCLATLTSQLVRGNVKHCWCLSKTNNTRNRRETAGTLTEKMLITFRDWTSYTFLHQKLYNIVYNITAFTVNSRPGFSSWIWRHNQDRIKIHCITHSKKDYQTHCKSRHNTPWNSGHFLPSTQVCSSPPWYFRLLHILPAFKATIAR
jgi:hypothetical protein